MRLPVVALALVLGIAASPARAALGTPDVVPAATLLVPYFEVDPNNPNAENTVFTVTNTQPEAALVNVTLWTDLGVPTRTFNAYLTGYDRAAFDLRLLLVHGVLEATASAGQDQQNVISPRGPLSQDINFASCNGHLPAAPLPAPELVALRHAHSGKSTSLFGSLCAARDHADGKARGYVTIDSVVACNQMTPRDAGYAGQLNDRNQLTGDFTLLDRAGRRSMTAPALHVEAAPGIDPYESGDPTFYGRFNGYSAADHREPLPTSWQAPFLQATSAEGPHSVFGKGTSEFLVWRDPDVAVDPFACAATLPSVFPLTLRAITAFDEEENPTGLTGTAFGLATQRVAADAEALGLVPTAGFLMLDLNWPDAGGGAVVPHRQAAVFAIQRSDVGHDVLLPTFVLPSEGVIP